MTKDGTTGTILLPQRNQDEDELLLLESLQYAVGTICSREDDNSSSSITMTTDSIGTLTQLVYDYTTTILRNDLQFFSEHANRKTITLDDVKLIARKNPASIYTQLQELKRYTTTTTTTGTSDETNYKQYKKRRTTNHLSFHKQSSTTKDDETMTLTQIRDYKLQKMNSSSSSSSDDDSKITTKRSRTKKHNQNNTGTTTTTNNNESDDDTNSDCDTSTLPFGMNHTTKRMQPKKFSVFPSTSTSSSSTSSDSDTETDLQPPSRNHTIAIDDDDDDKSSNSILKSTNKSSSDQSVIDLSG